MPGAAVAAIFTLSGPNPARTPAIEQVSGNGYYRRRSELGQAVPPHAVDSALGAYRDEGRRLAAAVKGIEAVEQALRGEPH